MEINVYNSENHLVICLEWYLNFWNAKKTNCALMFVISYQYGNWCLNVLSLWEPSGDMFGMISEFLECKENELCIDVCHKLSVWKLMFKCFITVRTIWWYVWNDMWIFGIKIKWIAHCIVSKHFLLQSVRTIWRYV